MPRARRCCRLLRCRRARRAEAARRGTSVRQAARAPTGAPGRRALRARAPRAPRAGSIPAELNAQATRTWLEACAPLPGMAASCWLGEHLRHHMFTQFWVTGCIYRVAGYCMHFGPNARAACRQGGHTGSAAVFRRSGGAAAWRQPYWAALRMCRHAQGRPQHCISLSRAVYGCSHARSGFGCLKSGRTTLFDFRVYLGWA